jgi:hypothetical protein
MDPDPDPGGPKTCGSGFATLHQTLYDFILPGDRGDDSARGGSGAGRGEAPPAHRGANPRVPRLGSVLPTLGCYQQVS